MFQKQQLLIKKFRKKDLSLISNLKLLFIQRKVKLIWLPNKEILHISHKDK